jgi:hypothetical protein
LLWVAANDAAPERFDKVIFSDEKKFNLDGPDGYRYYFRDLRKDPLILSRRQSGGGGIMLWGAIGRRGLSPLARINGKMNSLNYQALLQDCLLPHAERIAGKNWEFQQDGAAPHRAESTEEWFEENDVQVIDWAPYSPDLNIMENVWGNMSRLLYSNGKVYSNIEELADACANAWQTIGQDQDFIDNLFNSMPRRLEEVKRVQGQPIDY